MTKTRKFGISSLTLRYIAMALMVCDHLWATVVPGSDWLTWLGRLAFPIFAFLTAEGYAHTGDVKKYTKRMLLFALISEIPFNLMLGSPVIYPFHQNVMWTFLMALLCMQGIDRAAAKGQRWRTVLAWAGYGLLGYLVCKLLMTDYGGYGFLTVMVFHLFRGKKWWQLLGQLAGMVLIHAVWYKGLEVPLVLLGHTLNVTRQSAAVLALIPIWLYNGSQGRHSKAIQYACYAFYPAHMLVLALIYLYLM